MDVWYDISDENLETTNVRKDNSIPNAYIVFSEKHTNKHQ